MHRRLQLAGIFAQAGAVTVTSTGNIATAGAGAQGIFAAGSGTGAVTVTSIGNIAVAGTTTFGIVAENLGAGAVTVTSSGNITASGSINSNGIAAASAGGPITIIVNSGTVSGGSGLSAGVVFAGGSNNTLTNRGTLTALSGIAIVGEVFNTTAGGNNTVNNFGTVTGSVILDSTTAVGNMILGGGGGANAFNNRVGGVFNSGTTVSLGAGNTLTNAGTLSPGGVGVIQTTALSGNLVQTSAGRLVVDLNIAGATADRINVSGTANLAGAAQLQVQNPTLAPWQQTIVSATGGTTNTGLSLLASPVLRAQLVFPDPTDVVVKSAGLNFVTPGLNANQTALANALNGAAQTANLGGPIFNLLLNTTAAGYGPALTQLSGEAATGSQQTTFDAMNMFMGVMTDPFAGGRGDGGTPGANAPTGYASTQTTGAARDAYAMFTKTPPPVIPIEARWNVWAAGFGGSQNTDGNTAVGSSNTTSSIAGTAVGADYRFSPFTIAGFALAGGGTSFALSYGAKSVTDPRSELGLRTDKSFAMPDGILTLRGRVAWAHDYDLDRSIAATFQSLPGASFVVNGAAQASDSALVTASVEKKWLNGWSAAATFEGEFSNVTASYAGKGVVRYAW
jgi:uncharacterized protein with beta-barrel porin domain